MENRIEPRRPNLLARKFLINTRFQLKFMGAMGAMAAAVIACFFVAHVLFFQRFEAQGRALGLPPDHVFFQFLHQQQAAMQTLFAVSSLACLAVILVIGLVLSHRIAGPIYRLHRDMLEVAGGRAQEDVRFRSKDEFKELADAYNKLLSRLNDQGKGTAGKDDAA